MKNKPIRLLIFFATMIAMLSAACSVQGLSKATPTAPEPTATPLKEITICTAEEPSTLFYYGETNRGSDLIFEAIYDGPFDRVDYLAQEVMMDKVPNIEDGSASYSPVEAKSGDLIVDVHGNIVNLVEGVQIFPSGCQSMDCAATWDGISQVLLDQLIVHYSVKDGVRWSDGEPVKASDSLFSYQLVGELQNSKYEDVLGKIVDYQVVDAQTVKMSTLPGVVTSDTTAFFFSPLPQHNLESYAAGDLATTDAAARYPMGWGPFKVTDWQPGVSITLEKNEFYFRSAEGYPALDKIIVRFLERGESMQEMISSRACDVVDDSLITKDGSTDLSVLQDDATVRVSILPGENWKVLLFGIEPASYDDGYYPYGSDRPDLLSNAAFRNAIRQCIDQSAIVAQQSVVGNDQPFVYFPYDTQLTADASTSAAYDPLSAGAVLDGIGWRDYDANPATPRVAYGVANVPDGTVLSLNLYTTTSTDNMQIAGDIASSLTACGIQTTVYPTPATELYAEGPDGILFGRKFDLALITWNTGDELPCALFESDEIPAEDNYWIGANDGGGNIGGYQNAEFDSLCAAARFGSTDPQAALRAQVEAATILDEETPLISLFFDAKVYLMSPQLCLPEKVNNQKYPYSSLEYWDFRDTCN